MCYLVVSSLPRAKRKIAKILLKVYCPFKTAHHPFLLQPPHPSLFYFFWESFWCLCSTLPLAGRKKTKWIIYLMLIYCIVFMRAYFFQKSPETHVKRTETRQEWKWHGNYQRQKSFGWVWLYPCRMVQFDTCDNIWKCFYGLLRGFYFYHINSQKNEIFKSNARFTSLEDVFSPGKMVLQICSWARPHWNMSSLHQ